MKKTFKLSTYSMKRMINFHVLFFLSLADTILANERKENISQDQKLQEIRETLLIIQNELNNLNGTPKKVEENIVSQLNIEKNNKIDDLNNTEKINVDHQNPAKVSINQNSDNSYFFVIRSGFHILNNINLDFAHGPSGEIKTNVGYNLFLDAGKKMGNLDFGLGLGFHHSELDELAWINRKYSAKGETDTYQIQFNGGYNFQLNENINLRLGGALGFASRHDHYEIKLLSPDSINGRGINLSTQINLQLAVQVIEDFSIFSGYRFNYLGSSGSFGELYYNSFELGLMWNL